MFIIDAHLDLAMNALEWNRDLRSEVEQINALEAGMNDKPDRGNAVVSLPALRRGNIGLVVATQIARYVKPGSVIPGWNSPEQAWAQTQGQLAWYREMEKAGEMRQVKDKLSLQQHLSEWNSASANDKRPVGYILSLEGADSLVDLSYLEVAWEYGLRALGPAHYGAGRYANGTDATGKMDREGLALLEGMEKLNIILDATHLCDDAFWQALDHFNGHIWASHNNCRALVPHNRQFSDEQIKALTDRGGVIGAAMDAWMIVPGWKRGVSDPVTMGCDLRAVFRHIDHICQLTGNSLHVGIGSDLDGAFGKEQCPSDVGSIADVKGIVPVLIEAGYNDDDVANILSRNFMRFLENAWE